MGLIVSAVGVWRVGYEARSAIDRLAIANAESSQWALAQAEVEVLKFQIALERAVNDPRPEMLDNVRLRFDVFYSRIAILSDSPIFAVIRSSDDIGAAIEIVAGRLEELTAAIDGPSSGLVAALPEMISDSQEMSRALRLVSLDGIRSFSQFSEARREGIAEVLTDLAIFAAALVVLVLITLTTLLVLLFQAQRARSQIASAEDRLRAVVETAIDAVVVMDRNGRLLDYNGAAEQIFGYQRTEAIGRPITALLTHVYRDEAQLEMEVFTQAQDLLNQGGLIRMEARGKSGRRFPVEVATAQAQSTDGSLFVAFVRDISGRVLAEKELMDARDRALAGEKAKSELLAVMSHEMRTPINGIMGSLEILTDTPLNDRQRTFIDAISSSGNMLLRHVNTVLDISKIDAESAVAEKEVFSPVAVIERVVRSLQGQASARGNKIASEVLTDGLGNCLGDAARLEQVLINLVGNAIKFTEDGHINIEVERLPDGEMVEFRVVDDGIGIVPADLDRIFSEFVTVDSSYARTVDGTGLGLAISRRLCRLMGGDIGVESEKGEGSVFWMRLPLPMVGKASTESEIPDGVYATAPAQPILNLHLLLVEDNAINRLVASEMISQLGCTIVEAHDGEAAVEMAGKERFDVILMDISMPKLNGVEATERIRSACPMNAATPVIALTAHAQPSDIEHFKASGMSDVIIKPISKARLKSVLRGLDQVRQDDAVPNTDAEPGPLSAAAELVTSLGPGEAARITALAQKEIGEGLLHLLQTDFAPALHAEKLHQLVGLASVVGLDDLRSDLLDAQAALGAEEEQTYKALLVTSQERLEAEVA